MIGDIALDTAPVFTARFTQQFPIVARLFADGSSCIEYQPNAGDPERAAFGVEVDQLASDPVMAEELVENVFPASVPTDVSFFDIPGRRLGGIIAGSARVSLLDLVWQAALHRLGPADVHETLNAIVDPRNHWFFEILSALPDAMRALKLPGSFVAPWLVRLRARLGKDLASGSFWAVVDAYCQSQPEDGLSILEVWTRVELDDLRSGLAAHTMGELRGVCSNVTLKKRFKRIEAIFEQSLKPEMRCIYLQSWVQTAARIDLPPATVERLQKMVMAGTAQESVDWFYVLSRLPILDPHRYGWAVQTMEAVGSSDMADIVKHYFFQTVCHLGRTPTVAPDIKAAARRISLKLLPFSAGATATWGILFGELNRTLGSGETGAVEYVLAVAEKSADGWLEVARLPQMRGSAFRAEPAIVIPLLTSLLLSRSFEARWLGLHYFSELTVPELDLAALKTASDAQIEIIFRECQRRLVGANAMGRLFVMIWPRIHHLGGQLQSDFIHEAALQARSTKGFRDALTPIAAGAPELAGVLSGADRYFEALTKSQNSAAFQMRVAGFEAGRKLHNCRFSREVSAHSEKYSIFAQLARKMDVLYADRWTAIMDGHFGQSSQMQEMTVSTETPRLEFIDEEEMMWRRLFASKRIEEIESITGSA